MPNASSSTESSTDLHPSTSLQNTLYVDTVGAAVRREQNHFVVTGHSDGTTERLQSVPLPEVDTLALVGRVHCTMLALRFCLQETVQVVLLSPYGKVKGRLHGRHPANVDVRLGQYAAQDESARRLELPRRFVGAKVHNMRCRLRRTEDDTSYRAFRWP
jgi:CRISPR/Cas system-associated endonuclease Cas1